MAKRYDVTVYGPTVQDRDFFATTYSRPYWEATDNGLSVFVEEYEQVLFVKDGAYSGISVDVEEIDEPSAPNIGDTSELSRIEVE